MAGIRNSGHADLPLHTGTVPRWLADRMMVLGTLITESLVENFGPEEVLVRLSDPLWFQSFGAVMGMDWHSSGITTSVMYALKRGLNPRAKELGIYVCGGRGKYSRMTPDELLGIADAEGLDGDALVRNSKLVAKVDNNAVQDGFQLYQHNFVLTRNGSWAVVQQGMNTAEKKARRYHWCSTNLRSFVEEPHSGVVGDNKGKILNLTDSKADKARSSILEMSREEPERMINEILQIEKPASEIILLQGGGVTGVSPVRRGSEQRSASEGETSPIQLELFPEMTNERSIVMPTHHEVREQDVDLKRLGGVLATAYNSQPKDFEELLLTPGLGPRTLQSLALVSEVIYGTPSRFTDPARFSFAHGGKDGHPFPVPLKIYDESIRILRDSIEKSKLGYKDKSDCIRRLHTVAMNVEQNCAPDVDFDAAIQFEREHSKEWDGKTV
ncbi:hypothetical protein SAMN04487775_101189 [Treponema bryantii]|uniref:DUF763 domain-containing protein n=1 Tax=Treponema bryantii TaxID=163 RepID=A0A1I3HZC6_9SPIR|nr:DUF763 domain-containing protein [Treponema bryantii]SFI40963.1 hypothetical protein SAMN04487775_101189 [Treponema bryantii]